MNVAIVCNAIEERIAVGHALDEASQAHVLVCQRCAEAVAEYLALDALVGDELGGAAVPDGFADMVMAALPKDSSSWGASVLERRWVQVALAHLGAAVALANLLRFVFSSVIPSASLGGAP